MLSFFVLMVYVGGVFAFPTKNRGFFNRLTWPGDIGQELVSYMRRSSYQVEAEDDWLDYEGR